MRGFRLSLCATVIGLGVTAALAPTSTFAQQSQSLVNSCEELEERSKAAGKKAAEKIYESEHFEKAQEDRMSAFDCQMKVSNKLSSMVKGSAGAGILNSLFANMSDQISKKACDKIEEQAKEIGKKIDELDKIASDLPESFEEAKRRAEEAAEKTINDYAKQQVDNIISKLPKPPSGYTPSLSDRGHQFTPGYNPPVINNPNDPWAAIRDIWGK